MPYINSYPELRNLYILHSLIPGSIHVSVLLYGFLFDFFLGKRLGFIKRLLDERAALESLLALLFVAFAFVFACRKSIANSEYYPHCFHHFCACALYLKFNIPAVLRHSYPLGGQTMFASLHAVLRTHMSFRIVVTMHRTNLVFKSHLSDEGCEASSLPRDSNFPIGLGRTRWVVNLSSVPEVLMKSSLSAKASAISIASSFGFTSQSICL